MIFVTRFTYIVEKKLKKHVLKKWLDHLLPMTLYLVTIVKLILGDLGVVSRVERKGATKGLRG